MKIYENRETSNFCAKTYSQSPISFHRSEGFPARDIWFLGTLDQGSAQIPAFLGNRRRRRRRRHLILPGGAAASPDLPFKSAYRPPGLTDWFD